MLTAVRAQAACADAALNPASPTWSEIAFHASKFLMSVDANLTIGTKEAMEITASLIEPGEGVAVEADAKVLEMIYITDGFGRHTEMNLLLNAGSGAALQRTTHDTGGRFRHRIYRFTDQGAYHKTRWPIGENEKKLPPVSWSERSEALRAYPPEAVNALVTDPTALLYIIAAAPLTSPGDRFEILAYVRKHVHRVQIEVTEPALVRVDYEQHSPQGSTKREGEMEAIRLAIRGDVLGDSDDSDEFELLGLSGDIEVLMDPQTRAPVQLSGNVKIFGKVTFKAEKVVID